MKRLLLVVLLSACSGRFGSEEGGGSTDAGSWTERSPRALACSRLAEAMCARVDGCAPFLAQTTLGRGAACIRALADRCQLAAGLGGSQRTPESMDACAESVKASTCDAFLGSFPEPCEPPAGTLSAGSTCAFDEQCATTFCARAPDVACGVCLPAPRAGEPCSFAACARGLVCTSANLCAKPGRVGDACGPNEPCARLAFCDGSVCAPRRKVGEGCAGFGQCDAFGETACAANSICIATRVARKGEACDLTANALVLCEAPYRCIDDRCAEAKPEGATCGSAGSHECAGFESECIRGRCVTRVVEACAQK